MSELTPRRFTARWLRECIADSKARLETESLPAPQPMIICHPDDYDKWVQFFASQRNNPHQ